jgi:UDP-N-acetylglucosamine 2-epimerase
MSIFGTRPEAIKMAPLYHQLKKCPYIEPTLCVTAQHRGMLDDVLDIFNIVPDYDLDIMEPGQTLDLITIKVLSGLGEVLERVNPTLVLVHGDTTTTFVAALAAFYRKISVGHVEAGLRSYQKYAPYPEELNRKLTGNLSDLHFAPTSQARENLLKEGIDDKGIYVTGNTVIDAMASTVDREYTFKTQILNTIDFKGMRVVLLTAHRRENLGNPLEEILCGVRDILDNYPDTLVVYPVHSNPLVQSTANKVLGNHKRVVLTNPIDVKDLHNLMDRSYLILTDSGGLQEEGPSLGKPVLVLRDVTERPEGIKAGTVKLAGTSKEGVCQTISNLLSNNEEYNKMAKAINPYGDGKASERIVNAVLYHFGINSIPPEPFKPSLR